MVLIYVWIGRLIRRPILFFFLIACSGSSDKTADISILWNEEHAISISIPRRYFGHVSDDSVKKILRVHLYNGKDHPAILGEYYIHDDAVLFEPLIPFTRGLMYDVRVGGRSVARIEIPLADITNPPILNTIYPTQDTLPANLLKIYLQFSRPMQEGQATKHLVLLKNGKDTIPSIFLDLQPELWNNDRTTLTLWLDPGRIKRDLQPNKRLGEPLETAANYSLVIASDWMDTQGVFLSDNYRKDFFVASRDSLPPNPENWAIISPEAGTTNAVVVDFYEPLDAVLSQEAIHITDSKGNYLPGVVELSAEESVYKFTPEEPWSSGTFILQCEGRLEDLAGNNLNRPFDRDLTGDTASSPKKFFNRKFQIN